eukprot:Skav227541  [mRNA]  locus=scaffold2241:65831:82860:- [translate_table: standard]
METDEDEEPNNGAVVWPGVAKPKTLNEDPYNVFAEELAMEVCKVGFEVAVELMETELVFSSCGHLVSGTPDGGFRDQEGLLRLVQVVRVPLLPEMDEDEVADVLYDTVLTKVVKSQLWMKETAILPHDFMIFCWLPPVGAYKACLEDTDALLWTDALMWNLREGGWPFSLVIQVPQEPGKLFPKNFGARHLGKVKKDYATQVSYFLNAADFEDDDDEAFVSWDLFEALDASLVEDVVAASDVGPADSAMERWEEVVLPYVLLAIEMIQKRMSIREVKVKANSETHQFLPASDLLDLLEGRSPTYRNPFTFFGTYLVDSNDCGPKIEAWGCGPKIQAWGCDGCTSSRRTCRGDRISGIKAMPKASSPHPHLAQRELLEWQTWQMCY